MAKQAIKERIIVSPSLLTWNPSKFVYSPDFDLGIGEEWLPKHLVIISTLRSASTHAAC